MRLFLSLLRNMGADTKPAAASTTEIGGLAAAAAVSAVAIAEATAMAEEGVASTDPRTIHLGGTVGIQSLTATRMIRDMVKAVGKGGGKQGEGAKDGVVADARDEGVATVVVEVGVEVRVAQGVEVRVGVHDESAIEGADVYGRDGHLLTGPEACADLIRGTRHAAAMLFWVPERCLFPRFQTFWISRWPLPRKLCVYVKILRPHVWWGYVRPLIFSASRLDKVYPVVVANSEGVQSLGLYVGRK